MKEDGTQQNSHVVGTYLLTELAKLRDKHEIIGDVRGKGLQIGVEMVVDKVRAEGGTLSLGGDIRRTFLSHSRARSTCGGRESGGL